jgi:hypothetical protein
MEYVITTITTRTNTTHKSRRMMYLPTFLPSNGGSGDRRSDGPPILPQPPYATFTGARPLFTEVFTYEMIPAF